MLLGCLSEAQYSRTELRTAEGVGEWVGQPSCQITIRESCFGIPFKCGHGLFRHIFCPTVPNSSPFSLFNVPLRPRRDGRGLETQRLSLAKEQHKPQIEKVIGISSSFLKNTLSRPACDVESWWPCYTLLAELCSCVV